jgi:hypothetical protein
MVSPIAQRHQEKPVAATRAAAIGRLTLIGYSMENDILTFISLGPHENFYRDIKAK